MNEYRKEYSLAKSYHGHGEFNRLKGNYPQALASNLKALLLWEKLEIKSPADKKQLLLNQTSRTIANIGSIYRDQLDFEKALEYYLKAMEAFEKLNNKHAVAAVGGDIGNVYFSNNDYSKALEYYFKVLSMKEELGDKTEIAITLGNIGNVYYAQKDLNKSLEHFQKAQRLAEESGIASLNSGLLGNIGAVYIERGKSADNTGNSKRMFLVAEKYIAEALKLSLETGDKDGTKEWYQNLSMINSELGRHKEAFQFYKLFTIYKDSLQNEQNTQEQTRIEMNYEFEKREAVAKAEANKQAAVAEAEKKKQQIILLSVVGCLLLMVVFAGFIFRALRITKKQKRFIEQQKKLVEEKQKEILDSIHYAKRIQTALLPTEKYIDKHLNRLKSKMQE